MAGGEDIEWRFAGGSVLRIGGGTDIFCLAAPVGYRLIGMRGSCGGLLERSFEMSVIAEAFEVALAGEGTVVLIEGPAGIGKTSLVEAAVREADRLGARPMNARPSPLDREVAWNVVRQLFASTLDDVLTGSEPEVRRGRAVGAPGAWAREHP